MSAPESSSSDRIWRAQLQRQQEVVRNQGRIGHIGYEGPSSR
jgi:predicted DNA-binding WGR domain protein